MILAGAVTAQFGIDRAIPLPFRSQLPADLPSPAQLDELPEGAVRFAAIKRCLSRGLMGTKLRTHQSSTETALDGGKANGAFRQLIQLCG